jgi:hypothetical protein
MKIIHSFWTKPFLKNIISKGSTEFKADWVNLELYFMSWALSCCSFKRYYPDVVLYTDSLGKKILVDILGLPYSKSHTNLDLMSNCNPNLWAIGKIYTYNLQDEPFLHVDSDVFIWEKFSSQFTNQGIVAQNEEFNDSLYRQEFENIINKMDFIPADVLKMYQDKNEIRAANTGVFGGNDINFIKGYIQLVLNFIEKNTENVSKTDSSLINHFYEQYFLWVHAKTKKMKINYLLHNVTNHFDETLNFHLIPFKEKFIHVVGVAKKNSLACEQIMLRLKIDFPIYYEKFKKSFPEVKKILANVDI